MFKKISLVLIGILFSLAILNAQTFEYPDSTTYTVGFSTYLSHTDKYASGFDIYADSEGYTYVSGNTRDKNFPATEGAYQTELKGEADVFVVKFTPEGEIVFATLLGGTKREHHSGITVDDAGYIYIAGGTHSSDFPITEGSYDTSFNGEGVWAGDVFLTKLNPTGTEIIFSTFIGGEVEETVGTEGIRIDSKGNIIIVGTTRSHDFPLTRGVIDKEITQMHGFLSKFSPDGKKLLFSTFFGSSILDGITALAIDDKDNIYIMGGTFTADLPVTDNAVRKEMILTTTQGEMDHYIAKINATDNKIAYLSYFAGRGWPIASMKWTKPNRLLVCASAMEEGMPVTDNVIGKKGEGVRNCFISVFNSETMTLEYTTLFGGGDVDNIMNAHFLNKDTIVIGGMTNSSDFPLTENALYSDYPVGEKTFNNTFLGRRKSFISVIDIKNSKLLYSTYFGSCFLFYIHPDNNGNISFVAETGQKSEAGMTGFPVTDNAIMEPPSYTMVGRFLLNAIPEPEKVIVEVPVEDEILESYAGKYELTPGFILTINKYDSQLKVQVTGQGEGSIIPISQNVFVIKGVDDVQLIFNLNEAGEIESMTLHQNGMDNICKRLED
jgi:uncharacterized protein DUF3471/beta-propeller repeat-containing protein